MVRLFSPALEYHIQYGKLDLVDKLLIIGICAIMLFVVYQLGISFEEMMNQVRGW